MLRAKVRTSLLVMLVASLALSMSAAHAQPSASSGTGIEGQQDDDGRFRVLVFTETDFVHPGETSATAMIEELGVEHDFEVEHTDDSTGYFTDAGLAAFDVVIFNNTNGTITNTEERHAFERYIHRGGGYVGLHSASNSDTDWDWYTDLLAGGRFLSHPSIQEGLVLREDTEHPSTAGLDDEILNLPDEWYNYPVNPRDNGAHVLLTVDEDSYDLEDTEGHGDDHPISWCNDFDGGQVWYTAMGHFAEHYEQDWFIEHIHGGIEWAAGAAEGDCGDEREGMLTDSAFEKVAIDDSVVTGMNMAIAEDGRVFYVELFGTVKVWDPVSEVVNEIGEIDTDVIQENGLLGITLDPDFLDNGWIYLFYTDPDTSDPENVHQNVSRFDYVDGELDLDSEVVLIEIPHQREVCCHSSGDLHFDNDGNLIITVGDDTSWYQSSGYSPHDDRLRYDISYVDTEMGAKAYDARFTSGNTADLRGKILRISPLDDPGGEPGVGNTYDVPGDNLFTSGDYDHLFPDGEYDPDLGYPEIYAMGLRNPFKVAVDRETGWIYQGEVGPDAGSDDPDRGPMGHDEFNQIREAGNFGWPYCIADNKPYIEYDWETGESGDPFDCEGGPHNDSAFNTGLEVLPPAEDAFIYYPYGESEEFPEIPTGGGRAAYAGDVYHYDEDILDDALFPERLAEGQFPDYYDGAVFLMDWSRQWIGHATVDDDGDYVSFEQFMPDTQFLRPHGMAFGPDGAMYLLEFGSGDVYDGDQANVAHMDSGLYRIEYIKDGRSPVAEATASPDSGTAPLEVEFSSDGSFDPDFGELTFAWDLGDGETSDEPNPTHTYTDEGVYEVQLTVTNDSGRSDVDMLTITVGNTRPEVTIETPVDGRTFAWGEEISYSVSVEDDEDGSTGDGIDCEDVTVEVGLWHAVGDTDHVHTWASEAGCEGSFVPELDDDHGAEHDIAAVVTASYTDGGGDIGEPLTGETTHLLQPQRKQAQFYSDSSGITTQDSGDTQCCGEAVVGQDGAWVSYEPYNLEGVDELTLRAAAPLDDATVEVRQDAPDGDLLATASIEASSSIDRVEGPDGFGSAVQLNSGTPNEYVELPEGVVADLDDFTVAAWVDWDGDQTWTRIFDFGTGTGTNMFLTPNSGNGTLRYAITTSGAGGEQQINADDALPTDGWQHVAVTLEGTTGTLYLNGEVVGTNDDITITPADLGETDQNWIGNAQYADPLLDGVVDDFQIHDEALGEGDIQSLMDQPGGDLGGGNHLWYEFEEDEGETVVDSSGNDRDGVIVVGDDAANYEHVTVDIDDPGVTFALHLVFPDEQVRVNYLDVGDPDEDPDQPVRASLDPADPDGDNDWYVSPVTLTLEADDPDATLQWRASGDEDWVDYTDPVTFDEDGAYDLEYRIAGSDGDGDDGDNGDDQNDDGNGDDGGGDGVTTVLAGVNGWNFDPDEVTVDQGDTVVFEANEAGHNVVIHDADGDEVGRGGDDFSGDWVYEFVADEAGSFTFTCEPHAGMDGTLEVVGDDDNGGDPGDGEVYETSFSLDQAPPETEVSVGDEQAGEVEVSLAAEDVTSGVDVTHYRIDGGDEQSYDGSFSVDAGEAITVEFRSVDVAGNVEEWQSVEVDDPGGPGPHDEVCSRHQGGASFPDVPGSGHGFFIACLAELGIVEGHEDGLYRPANDVSREQLASYVVRAIEVATGETLEAGGELFPDVSPTSTHGQAVYKLRNAGIIRGYEDGTFGPRGSVTRDQTARYVVNALEYVLDEPLATSGVRFADVVFQQYVADIDKLATAGVIQGYEDGTFGPRQPVTRGQMARFVANGLEVLAAEGAYDGP